MEKSQIWMIIFVLVIVIVTAFITINLSENKASSIIEKRLKCTVSDNFASSPQENGDAYCGFTGKKCLIAERQIRLSRYLDASKSQIYLTDAYSQTMGCEVSFKNYDEKSEIASGNDPELFANIEFNAICCG
ncbi:MAG: hypothetical protein AABW91_02965 [Nanoarchaeota archaeon]